MSIAKLTDAFMYADQYAISGDLNSIEAQRGQDVVEVTAFGDTTRKHITSSRALEISADAWFQAGESPDQIEKIVHSLWNAGGAINFSFGPTEVENGVGYLARLRAASFSFGGAHGEAPNLHIEGQSAEALYDAISGFVGMVGSKSASFTGTGLQYGAASATQTVYSVAHITAFNGTTLDIDIESDDNSGFTTATTRVSFTQFTAVGSERVSVAGPITDDYWRVNTTFVGTSYAGLILVGIV